MKKMKRTWLLFIGLFLLFVGLVCSFQAPQGDKNYQKSVKAVVTDIISEEEYIEKEDRYETRYYPLIQYRVDKKVITSKFQVSVDKNKYKIGEKIDICYHKSEIDQFILKTEKKNNYFGIIMVISGFVIALLGVVYYFKKK